MQLHDITALGRAVDPKVPTNRALLVVMAVALLAATIAAWATGMSALDAGLDGLHAAVLVFLAWALGREVAPDDQAAAFAAIGVVAAVWVGWGARADLLPAFALLGLLRIVNRTVGPPAKLTDLFGYLALGSWLVWRGDWEIGVAGGVALLLDFRLAPRHLKALPFAAALVAVTVAAWRRERPVFGPPDTTLLWIAAVAAGAFVLVLVTQPTPISPHDIEDESSLDRRRVQGGMAVALVAAMAALGRGQAHLLDAAAVWAAIMGTVVTRPLHLVRRRLG